MNHLQLLLALFQLIFICQVCKGKPFTWESITELGDYTFFPPEISALKYNNSNLMKLKPFGSDVLKGQPLYLSLTTIHSRIYGIASTIESIISGTVWPDHIYIFVSRDPYLLDLGVSPEYIMSESKGKLIDMALIYPWISIIFTDNIGPHRKLLPLLAKKWDEDCVIITIDDHETYKKTALESLLLYYESSNRQAVIALRTRRMGICSDAPPWRISPYTNHLKGLWPVASSGRKEMLTLPTGM